MELFQNGVVTLFCSNSTVITHKVWGKVMFSQTSVIPSVQEGSSACKGESASRWCLPRGGLPPVGVGQTLSEHYRIQSTSRRYASYWNTFLFSMRTVSLVLLQSCRSVDVNDRCERDLTFLSFGHEKLQLIVNLCN